MERIGTVETLCRYPVKSMAGEDVAQAFVGFAGLMGDRAFAFVRTPGPKGFRANLYADWAEERPYRENELVGRTLQIGERLRLVVLERDPRCKMITIDPRDRPSGTARPGGASVVCADDNSQINGSFAQQPVAIVSNSRTAVNEAAKPLTTEEGPLLAPSQRDGTMGRTTAWVRLTEPGGKPIHINVEHVTSVRADTQIPGARAQLDLTSGKFQGVQEDIEQVMQLISSPGARENEEAPSAGLKLSTSSLPKTSTSGPR
jgi:hypothetical protein